MKMCLPCKLVLPVRKCGPPTQKASEENGGSVVEDVQGKSPEERKAVEKIATLEQKDMEGGRELSNENSKVTKQAVEGEPNEKYAVVSKPPTRSKSDDSGAVVDKLGHEFKVVRQNRPKTCDGCGEIIWHDALVCQVCQVTVHEESCKHKLSKACNDGRDEVNEVAMLFRIIIYNIIAKCLHTENTFFLRN